MLSPDAFGNRFDQDTRRLKWVQRGLLAIALSASIVVSGCSFTPVYRQASVGSESRLLLDYAKPTNRLSQIIYQDLATRLGTDNGPDAALVTVSVGNSSRRVGRSSAGSSVTLYEMQVSGMITVVSSGDSPETLLSLSRSAAAQYEITGQALADENAAEDAGERAAHALADSMRLTILAELNNR